MSSNADVTRIETKSEAEALIPLFNFQKVLKQDQNGRRITLLGTIKDAAAILTIERAAFPSDPSIIASFLSTLTDTINLGANDVYRWYMSGQSIPGSSTTSHEPIPNLKLNLIYPCTEAHVRKYTSQTLRYVTETPQIYRDFVKPYIDRTQRTPKRLDWIYNILDGITEQEDVIYRSPDFDTSPSRSFTGFLLLPDLNWDRKTLSGLHLLALVQRRDIASLRDLRHSHIPWLRSMLDQIKTAAAKRGTELAVLNGNDTEVVEPDQVKCYVHYHPTYYHFHVHVVHVMLEPEGNTQSVGKAFGLEMIIAILEGLKKEEAKEEDPGLANVDLTYFVGEASEFWIKCFGRIKKGEKVNLLDE